MSKQNKRGVKMVKEDDLTKEGNDLLIKEWEEGWKKELLDGINKAIERGNADKDVLWIMRELVGEGAVRPKKKTIEEYFEEQDKLNK
jgi:hypothetical protein